MTPREFTDAEVLAKLDALTLAINGLTRIINEQMRWQAQRLEPERWRDKSKEIECLK